MKKNYIIIDYLYNYRLLLSQLSSAVNIDWVYEMIMMTETHKTPSHSDKNE